MSKRNPRQALKQAMYETEVDIFTRKPDESAKTICILGRSYSGKTHFLVEQLNKIVGKTRIVKGIKRPIYDAIFLFSESLSAEPLTGLSKELKVHVVQGYIPRVVQLLKQINSASDNSFRFLVIMDDVITNIRSGTFAEQILTMRNAQITTCFLIQYVKLISPAIRNSVHHYYITGLKPEEWEYLNKSFLASLAKELVGNYNNSQLAVEFKRWVGDDIVHYDQRRDEISFIQRNLSRS